MWNSYSVKFYYISIPFRIFWPARINKQWDFKWIHFYPALLIIRVKSPLTVVLAYLQTIIQCHRPQIFYRISMIVWTVIVVGCLALLPTYLNCHGVFFYYRKRYDGHDEQNGKFWWFGALITAGTFIFVFKWYPLSGGYIRWLIKLVYQQLKFK